MALGPLQSAPTHNSGARGCYNLNNQDHKGPIAPSMYCLGPCDSSQTELPQTRGSREQAWTPLSIRLRTLPPDLVQPPNLRDIWDITCLSLHTTLP